MTEYRIVSKEVPGAISRDVSKAARELEEEVGAALKTGWVSQGGIASVQAGTSVYLLQALTKG